AVCFPKRFFEVMEISRAVDSTSITPIPVIVGIHPSINIAHTASICNPETLDNRCASRMCTPSVNKLASAAS
ncbi:MAG: hypothetical protein PUJ80_01285, partial [Verrucomicrobiota bacterium]|nr:hypothetical protein [Verrucomicrobiota bacterium]